MVTVIIPVGTNDFSRYQRVLSLRATQDPRVSTMLVADGCEPQMVEEIRSYCSAQGFMFVDTGTSGEPFSAARARNVGINRASSEWIIQEDADLVLEDSFYHSILRELERIDQTPFNFLTVPTIYLAEEISDRIRSGTKIGLVKDEILTALAFEDPRSSPNNNKIQSYAPASGVLVHRRAEGISIGGYDEAFAGWGGEDRDFAYRLLLNNDRLPRPDQFEFTAPWNLNDTVAFQGWRSLYRLVGDYLAIKGVYAFHLFHPKNEWRDERAAQNLAMAAEKAHRLYLEQPLKNNWDELTAWGTALQGSILFDRYRHHGYIAKSGMMQISETSLNYKARQWRTAESRQAESQAYKYGCAHFHRGDYAAALENFLAAAKIAPKSTKYLRSAAEAQIKLGRRKDAAATLIRASLIEPNSKQILNRLAYIKRPRLLNLLRSERPFEIPLPDLKQ